MERNEKKNIKLRLKVLLGALALVLVGTGAYYWNVQSQSGSSKTEEVIKDTNNTQKSTSSTAPEQSPPSNKKQEQAPNPQEPNQGQTPDSSTSESKTDVWETEAKLLQGDVVTVTKDTPVHLFDYFEVRNVKPGIRACLIDFSDSKAVEVLEETPNATPTLVKFKSDVTVTVVTGKNKVNIQFKVK